MKKLNRKGFSPIIILLLILLLLLLGFSAWYVMSKNKAKPKGNANQSQAQESANESKEKKADPYDGWQSFTTTYEKMAFKYPTDLTLTDTSSVDTDNNVTPGMDRIKLKAAGGFEVSIQTGLYGIGGGCPECTIDFSDPLTIAGTNYYINFVNNGSGKISSVTASKIMDDFIGGIDGKTITIVGTANKAATLISASFRDANGDIVEKTLADYKADQFVKNFKLLLQSISY